MSLFSTRTLQSVERMQDAELVALTANVPVQILANSAISPRTRALSIVSQGSQVDLYIGLDNVLADGSNGGELLTGKGDSIRYIIDNPENFSVWAVANGNLNISVNRYA